MARHYHHHHRTNHDDTAIIIAILAVLGWFYWRPLWSAVQLGWPWAVGLAIVLALTILLVHVILHQGQRRQNQALLDVQRMSKMSGIEFEAALKVLFEAQGYGVKLTPKTGDFGADLLLRKGGKLAVCQAKRYKENVGITGVQEVIGARAYYHADSAMCVTTAGYTKAAKALAQEAHVEIWSRTELAAAVQAATTKKEVKAHA